MAGLLGQSSLIVTDVGGTSFEAALLEDGSGLVTDEYEIEWEMPITVPMLDMHSIGAGGGSIAWIDEGGSLRVGPASAGARPGPACYGLGGALPTVTDANLVLGRIDPLLGGKFQLDRSAAESAIDGIGSKLGLSVSRCAAGILEIVNEHMAAAIRMVSSDRGRDPRDHSLVAFGGAGGLHAVQVARAVGVREVIVPSFLGVACAFGATTMNVRHDLETTYYEAVTDVKAPRLEQAFADLENGAKEALAKDGIAVERMRMSRFAAMRYIGQSYEVWTPAPARLLETGAIEDLVRSFYKEHEKEYGVFSETFPVAIVNLRVTAEGLSETQARAGEALATEERLNLGSDKHSETRAVYFEGKMVGIEVLQRASLKVGDVIRGPSIIEQADGVVVLEEGSEARIDEFKNIRIVTVTGT